MNEYMFYMEFDPRNFRCYIESVIAHAQEVCQMSYGKRFNPFDMLIGRIPANEKMYFLRASFFN